MLVIIVILISALLVLFAAASYFLYRMDIKKLGQEPTFADYCQKSTFGRKNAVIFLNGVVGFVFLIFIENISDGIVKLQKGWDFDIGIMVIELNWIRCWRIKVLI